MTEKQAEAVAAALGGNVWDSGGGMLLVTKERSDGKVVAISSEVVAVYDSMDDLQGGQASESILLE